MVFQITGHRGIKKNAESLPRSYLRYDYLLEIKFELLIFCFQGRILNANISLSGDQELVFNFSESRHMDKLDLRFMFFINGIVHKGIL